MVTDAMTAGQLGYIDTPAQGNLRPAGVTWCADNGCFSDRWDQGRWWAFLVRNAHAADSCLFAVAPDVVADHDATLKRATPWLPKIRELGYPVAFVAQNGVTIPSVPWQAIDVIFLGGSLECVPCGHVYREPRRPDRDERCPHCSRLLTEWKLGAAARALVAAAKARGKRVHMGRVNSARRWRYAAAIGCDSVDGTYLTFAPDANLPKVLAWGRRLNEQGALFGGVA
jgi:hypothetical protein